jgi:tight adherence protein C
MSVLILSLAFVTVTGALQGIYYVFFGKRSWKSRLTAWGKNSSSRGLNAQSGQNDDFLARPFWERAVMPLLERLSKAVSNFTPRGVKKNIEKYLMAAGYPLGLSVSSILGIYTLLLLLLSAGVILLAVPAQTGIIKLLPWLLLLPLLLALLLTLFLLKIGKKRRAAIKKQLPDFLDLLLISVEAGLGFDLAMQRVAERIGGILGEEFERTLQEISMGKPRAEALRHLVKRTGVEDLQVIVGAIIQAEQLGTGIAHTLRIQAGGLRQKRKQKAEEAAMKAPIKMLFPLVFFIFPAIFVVLLGPVVIRVVQVLFEVW